MVFTFLNHPSAADALDFSGLPRGTAEAVPFQKIKFLALHIPAILLPSSVELPLRIHTEQNRVLRHTTSEMGIS
jgi:hypothetical protein